YQAIPGSYGRGRYHEGQTLGEIYGFEFDRFFEESDFSGKNGSQWIYKDGVASQVPLQATGSFVYGPGDVKYKDLDGDGKITIGDPNMKDEEGNPIPVASVRNHGDTKVIGNMLPRYEYSFRLGAAWKGFDVDLYFQGVGKRNMWYVSSYIIPMAQSNGTGIFEHQLDCNSYIFDANNNITGYNVDQNNFYPVPYASGFSYAALSNNMLGQGAYNFLPSDRYLLNMAYLRLKNVTVGYTLPIEITKKALIQKARVYFSTENPCFIYNGANRYKIDPEINTGEGGMGVGAYGRTNPMMASYSFGIQVTF
ncbi:MAG: SusC/RagA family protein, partial [Muribaculaceae bacterium]|nr:SusC/RagA family protein [Muribaculaceae bacterium]